MGHSKISVTALYDSSGIENLKAEHKRAMY